MKVYITLDYEIFFGDNQGSIENTLINPTQYLIEIAERNHVNFTFFIDIGFLLKLEEYRLEFPKLEIQYEKVVNQVKLLQKQGHDCQLHIHPHWEKAIFNGNSWVFDYSFYKLADFTRTEINGIFSRYASKLEELTQNKVHSFRAGGWCIQPFTELKSAFHEQNILIDSSVFKGGKHIDKVYNYDFTIHPKKDFWQFNENECVEEEEGKFIELPISSHKYSPLFFWRLFILGNLFPKNHKPIGDGKPMPSNLTRKKFLTQTHLMCASVDGYFSSKMEQVVLKNKSQGFQNTVFIGHPKALTYFSLKKLERFIINKKSQLEFKTFTQFKDEISR